MLGTKTVAAMLPVSDLQAARKFYESTLGLTQVGETGEAIVYKSAESYAVVYRSAYAGTNQATAAAWSVGDELDATVEALRGKGVSFEHYDDLPDATREGDVHVMGDFRAAWFKDPDGNILSVVNQTM